MYFQLAESQVVSIQGQPDVFKLAPPYHGVCEHELDGYGEEPRGGVAGGGAAQHALNHLAV